MATVSVVRADVALLVGIAETVKVGTGDVMLGRARRAVRQASLLLSSVVVSEEVVVLLLLRRQFYNPRPGRHLKRAQSVSTEGAFCVEEAP